MEQCFECSFETRVLRVIINTDILLSYMVTAAACWIHITYGSQYYVLVIIFLFLFSFHFFVQMLDGAPESGSNIRLWEPWCSPNERKERTHAMLVPYQQYCGQQLEYSTVGRCDDFMWYPLSLTFAWNTTMYNFRNYYNF